MIAAGGYVVNDIEDVDIDRLNKPEHKRIVGRVYPLSIAWKIYWFITILGFGISLYLAFFIHDFVQLAIYPAAVALLWAYSKWFKRQFLIGNLVVAGFCAFVAWVVLYAQSLYTLTPLETELVPKYGLMDYKITVNLVFGGYAIFAFISTLFRELIKDMEDVAGDKAQGCQTVPIVLGIKTTKIITFLIGSVFILIVLFFSYLIKTNYTKLFFLNVTILFPVIYALFLLIKAKEKADYSLLAKLAKLIMLSGLIFILIMK